MRTATPDLPADFVIEDHGSIILVRPLVHKVAVWLDEHTQTPSWFGTALVCEPRYAQDLVYAMLDEGFVL